MSNAIITPDALTFTKTTELVWHIADSNGTPMGSMDFDPFDNCWFVQIGTSYDFTGTARTLEGAKVLAGDLAARNQKEQ